MSFCMSAISLRARAVAGVTRSVSSLIAFSGVFAPCVASVVAVAARGTQSRELEQTLPHGAVLQLCLRGVLRRVAKRNHPLAGESSLPGSIGGSPDLVVGKPGAS